MSGSITFSSFVFDGPLPNDGSGLALKITAKRYTQNRSEDNILGLTLLFAHCIGSHKEQWEPTIQRIFDLQSHKHPKYRIREAWAFDWQNHGDAAILNKEVLAERSLQCVWLAVYEWGAAIAKFVRSPHMKGHRIVPFGHSAGTAAMVLSTLDFSMEKSPYISMVLIESSMATKEVYSSKLNDRLAQRKIIVGATVTRCDTWPSREAAFLYFSKKFLWKMWDPRVIRLLCTYGLIDTPTGAVTLKCDKMQEAMSYPDDIPQFEAAAHLSHICHSLPVHLIWGTRSDIVPEFIQDSLSDESEGRCVASVSKVENAGHMIVQEVPDQLASAIIKALDTIEINQVSQRSNL